MSTLEKEQEAIEWRRSQIISLRAKGYNQTTIAKKLGWSIPTISKDIAAINAEAKDNLKTHLETRLVIETEKIISGIEEILLDTWKDLDSDEKLSLRDKLSCRSLIKDLYAIKLNILTSAPVIQRGLNYVQMYRDKLEQLKQERDQPIEEQNTNKEGSSIQLSGSQEEELGHEHYQQPSSDSDADEGSIPSTDTDTIDKPLFEKKKPEPIYE